MSDECPGRGQCHGPLKWCAACGDVDDVCSAVDCDAHGRRDGRCTRLAELLQELNTPEMMDFIKGIRLEAVHQRERWGVDHDGGKTDAEWYWLVAHLAGKALHLPEKRLHHLITCAAALANWHLYSLGKTSMRPGIAPPTGRDVAGYGVLGTERRQRERWEQSRTSSKEEGSAEALDPAEHERRARELRDVEVAWWEATERRLASKLSTTTAREDHKRLGDALLLQASEMREVMEAARAEAMQTERARCVAIARVEEALWREEGAKPVEQRNMLASTQAVMAAEATAGRIATAMEAAQVALRSAQKANEGRPVLVGGKERGTAFPTGRIVVEPAEREEHPAGSIEHVRQALAMAFRGAEEGSGWWHILDKAISELSKLRAKASPEPFGSVPMNVEMWCPFCGLQHVESGEWVTRVHHTHLCSGCRRKWRVAPAVFGVRGMETVALDTHRALPPLPPSTRAVAEELAAVLARRDQSEAHELRAKLDVASSRAAEAVMRFSGVEEQVRFEVVAAVRQAVNGALDPTHQGALAKLQHDVQKADQRADKASARVAELEVLLDKERRPVRCRLCEQDIAPGTMVSATIDGRVVHSTCPSQPAPRSGAL